MIAAIRARLRAIFRRGALDREMRDEMALHLEQTVDRLMRRGLSEADARDAARREFGNIALLQEEGRDARGVRWIESLAADGRYALRHFSRTPLTAITLVLVLALGIGVNSALFSVLQAFTLRPPPAVAVDESLVRVRGTAFTRASGRSRGRDFSGPEFAAIAERRETFASVAGWTTEDLVVDLVDGNEPRVLHGQFVTPNYFATLGVRPVVGPGLPAVNTDDAPGAEMTVVIAHRLWDVLGGGAAVIGRVVRVNGMPIRVVGVAPPRFEGARAGAEYTASLWLPLAARAPLMRSTPSALVSRDSSLLEAVARLTPMTTRAQAAGVVRVLATAWAATDRRRPVTGVEYSSDVVPMGGDPEMYDDPFAPLALGLAGTVGLLILLITCTNVSALLVGAGVARRREVAIRLSLGASRQRLVRQLVTESSMIAVTGGALGLFVLWAGMRVLSWTAGAYGVPPFEPDLATAAFTAVIALGTGVVFGLSPALHATKLDVANALKDAGGGATSRSRLQRAFIVAQIGLTQPLLVGLVLVLTITKAEFGQARADHRLSDRITTITLGAGGESNGTPNAKHVRIRDAMDRVARLPGVERVMPDASPFDVADLRPVSAERASGPRADEIMRTRVEGAAPGYFAFLGIPLLRGRDILASDTAGAEMAIVIGNDLARDFWGTADPVGKRLNAPSSSSATRTAIVIGVFDTTAVGEPARRVYTALGARWRKESYLVRTVGPGTSIIPTVRQMAHAALPDIPIRRVATLEQIADRDRQDMMMVTASAAGGGLLALLLASIGLYGVVALSVRQRHREIGIRVALGAHPRQVIAMFFRSGLRLSVIGIAFGLPLSVAAVYALVSTIAGVRSNNVMPFGAAVGIALVVVVVASLATWIPARKAASVDPLNSIRVE
jgi:predicted permease